MATCVSTIGFLHEIFQFNMVGKVPQSDLSFISLLWAQNFVDHKISGENLKAFYFSLSQNIHLLIELIQNIPACLMD